jgi:hypothetical protein
MAKRIWICDRCLKRGPWDKGTRSEPQWRWHFMGGAPISVFCSDECEGDLSDWPEPQNPYGC